MDAEWSVISFWSFFVNSAYSPLLVSWWTPPKSYPPQAHYIGFTHYFAFSFDLNSQACFFRQNHLKTWSFLSVHAAKPLAETWLSHAFTSLVMFFPFSLSLSLKSIQSVTAIIIFIAHWSVSCSALNPSSSQSYTINTCCPNKPLHNFYQASESALFTK